MKKGIQIVSFFLLIIFILAGCNKKDVTRYSYTYQGETELWKAAYKVDTTVTFTEKDGKLDGETDGKGMLVIEYKGELADLLYVRHSELSYEYTHGKEILTKNYGDGESITSKVFTLNSSRSGVPLKDDIIKVSINMDGNIQTLELTNKNKN